MSTYTDKKFKADDYSKFRPVYPASLYEHLREYVNLKPGESVSFAVDLACGTGQATLAIAGKIAERVVGIDNSEVMIKTARDKAREWPQVTFLVGNDKTLVSQIEPESVDLLTVAEAAHYLSYPEFWEAAHRILKPGGTLAIWSYYLPNIIGHPTITKAIEDFGYNPQKCGGYWDDGVELLKEGMYANLVVPSGLFKEEERSINDYHELRPEHPFELVKQEATVRDLVNLLGTWSPYHKWKMANLDKEDIVEEAQNDILSATGLELESKVTFKWETVFVFARRRSS